MYLVYILACVCNQLIFIIVTVLASSPPDTDNWLGDIESAFFDEREGTFSCDKHGISVKVPAGAIRSGMKAELKVGATLFAPVKPVDNNVPPMLVSAIVWLSMGVKLQKPMQIQIPHCVSVNSETEANKLQFARSHHFTGDRSIMKALDGGNFAIGKSFGTIEVDRFSYYTIEYRFSADDIDKFKYQAVVFQNKRLLKNILKFEVCIMPDLPTFLTVSILYFVLNVV